MYLRVRAQDTCKHVPRQGQPHALHTLHQCNSRASTSNTLSDNYLQKPVHQCTRSCINHAPPGQPPVQPLCIDARAPKTPSTTASGDRTPTATISRPARVRVGKIGT